MTSEDAFNAVVEFIYDAALDTEQWPDAIGRVAAQTNGFAASLVTIDVTKHNIPEHFGSGWPEGFFADYSANYAHLDPRMAAFLAKPDIDIYTDAILVPKDVQRKDPIYAMGRRVVGQHFSYGARLFAGKEFESTLIMARSEGQGEASPDDVSGLRRLLPHLRRSVALTRKFGERVTTAALEAFTIGVVIVDQHDRVSYVNRAMSALAAARDGVSVTRTGLHLSDPDDHAALHKLLGMVRRRQHLEAGTGRTVLTARRPSGRRPYGIIVCPFRRTEFLPLSSEPSVMICVSDPAAATHFAPDVLGGLFGLTSTESRLVAALVELGSLAQAAGACKLTEGSARQYMKRIFSKTETRGQVDLVALILGTVRL